MGDYTQLQIIKKTYTDNGSWAKIHLKIGFDVNRMTYSDPEFPAMRDELSRHILECIEEHKKPERVINYLHTIYFSGVTEIDTGRGDFGAFIDDLIRRLRQHYHVEVSDKE